MPAPERLPVECWQPIQSGSERAFDLMAKYRISGVIGGGSAEGGAVALTRVINNAVAIIAVYVRSQERGLKGAPSEELSY